ncbi:cell wall elongation regulator TseB-like domain-containing protein [Bacillus benzoevorans]|uniref:Uncharacterized protein YpmB n=1 Tax=Bacillus benzoevorans TaxID=1456 RepID=A0A7X0LVK2_9BACI|nr:DUF5590 domain-containing protein [Bacillus benzoevorans]MBB6444672.1 uncharacterized protein YpmB [Bacillus benzoevorans]
MKKWITIISIAVLVLILLSIKFYMNALEPVKAAEKKAITMAKEESALTTINDFYVFYGEEAYAVVQGKDKKGTKWIVWVPEKKGEVISRKALSGMTQQEAVAKLLKEKNPSEIISVKLGMENNRPLWEIHYRANGNSLNYYYVDFKTGEKLRKIENL